MEKLNCKFESFIKKGFLSILQEQKHEKGILLDGLLNEMRNKYNKVFNHIKTLEIRITTSNDIVLDYWNELSPSFRKQY